MEEDSEIAQGNKRVFCEYLMMGGRKQVFFIPVLKIAHSPHATFEVA
jgi:hypothetical protein